MLATKTDKLRSALAYDLHLLNCPLTVKSSLVVYSPSEKDWWMLCFDFKSCCTVGNLLPHFRDSLCVSVVVSGKVLGYCNGLDSEKSEQLLNIVLESVSLLQGEHMNHESENHRWILVPFSACQSDFLRWVVESTEYLTSTQNWYMTLSLTRTLGPHKLSTA